MPTAGQTLIANWNSFILPKEKKKNTSNKEKQDPSTAIHITGVNLNQNFGLYEL